MSNLAIKKTYKLYIGGKFPRTESGRILEVRDKNGELLVNASFASRKDFRNSVVAARGAFAGWAKSTAYLKGLILYRIAEVLEGRKAQFIEELTAAGMTIAEAQADVAEALGLLVYYAGWSDKYQAVFSSVNPVASAHFNFSVPEPSGVVAIAAPSNGSLASLVSTLAPVLVGGNAIVLLSSHHVMTSISFAEVLVTSDVPGGVVNILTGSRAELVPELAKHMDVNSLLLCSDDVEERKSTELLAAENLKRVVLEADSTLKGSPYHITDFQEIKTTWHPIGV